MTDTAVDPAHDDTEDDDRFFGLWEAIRDAGLPGLDVQPLYHGYYAGFYDFITAVEDYDLDFYLARAAEQGSPILDIAAGSGRISIPLARAGHRVTAVDLAEDMLRGLRRHLLAETPEVAARVQPVHADARDYRPPVPHPLALIGATSICLLRDEQVRIDALRGIRDSLTPDGRFCLDFLETSPEALRTQDARVITAPLNRPGRHGFTLMGTRWYPDEAIQVVNFYAEDIDPLGRTQRFLGTTTKGIVEEADLRRHLEAAGFEVLDRETVHEPGEDGERVQMLTCRPA